MQTYTWYTSRPLLNLSDARHMTSTQKELQEEYYRSGRMMLQMAQVCIYLNHMYVCVYIYIYIYIYLCVCVYMYLELQ
jgi:hypothetical protein